jgi:aspartyl aminopeptidase
MTEEASRTFANEFVTYLNEATTAFHAVDASKQRLVAAGFQQLNERDAWTISKGGKYFFTRNDTSVFAFSVGEAVNEENVAFTALGAHTDSPCLKIKPVATINKSNALMVNTQPYGSGLWHTWFDRDLGIAGRAIIRGSDGSIQQQLFQINDPIARIPNLAIHLTSGAEREGFAPNLQEHGKALLSIDPDFVGLKASGEETEASGGRIHPGLLRMVAKHLNIASDSIEDLEMQLIDLQPSTIGGACQEFIYSGRLDNLCSAYQCLRAVVDTAPSVEPSTVKIAMLFDHEEIGSNSCQGAGSSMFMDTLKRIHESLFASTSSSFMRSLRRSFVVSADMAHGLHPNYQGKHDSSMAPLMNQGLVIKHNANQRYATNALSATVFRRAAKMEGIPVQEFTVRSDSGCGSTIGPIIATLSGILTVDCGTPQFSMHSIREMMGTSDAYIGYFHLTAVFKHHPTLCATLN